MISKSTEQKYQKLREILVEMRMVIVAYSGGIDSTLLLRIGQDVLGVNCIGVIGLSPSLSKGELEEALNAANSFNAKVVQIETDEMNNPHYVSNDNRRCYHCKFELYSTLIAYAQEQNIKFILDGNNYDDLNDYRPGREAAKQLDVRSPFVEAELTKEEIRQLARFLGLPNWKKPAQPCLSSRMAYGQQIDLDILNKIASAESYLKNQGFKIVRVRYWGDHISIEVGQNELERLFDSVKQSSIRNRFREMGFPRIEFDREGYRSGKLNQIISAG